MFSHWTPSGREGALAISGDPITVPLMVGLYCGSHCVSCLLSGPRNMTGFAGEAIRVGSIQHSRDPQKWGKFGHRHVDEGEGQVKRND